MLGFEIPPLIIIVTIPKRGGAVVSNVFGENQVRSFGTHGQKQVKQFENTLYFSKCALGEHTRSKEIINRVIIFIISYVLL